MNVQNSSADQARHVVPRVAEADSSFSRIYHGLLASLGAALLFVSAPAFAIAPPDLGEVQSFAILGGMNPGVTFAAPMNFVNGDVGIEPTALLGITGMGNATLTAPFAYYAPPASDAARAATTTLYNDPLMAPAGGVAIVANMSTGGPTANGHYTPGKYSLAAGTAIIPTSITLDGPGIYIFSLNSDLTTSVGSSVILNGVDPCSVFWRVPTLATLDGDNFPGTIVAGTGVHMGVGADLTGRALAAAAGDVTLAGSNTVGGCSAPGGTLGAVAGSLGLAATTVSTAASAGGALGVAISDTATLSGGGLGGAAPTGSITFSLYAPSDAFCAALPVFTSVVPITGNGIYTSTSFPSAATGAYHWIASYLVGDANNDPFVGACNAAGESVTITAVPPPVAAAGIPTLSEWAMIMLAALLAFMGFAAMRRQAR